MDRKTDVAISAALAVVSALVLAAVREHVGASGLAMGTDPVLWALSARNIEVGVDSIVPPTYPALTALLDLLPGVDLVSGGLMLSAIAQALLSPTIYWTARALDASRPAAAVVSLLHFTIPAITFMGLQLQPDALTCLAMAATPLVLLWYLASPTWPRMAALGLFLAAFSLLREHGLMVAGITGGFVLVPRARLSVRAMRGLAVAVAILLGPVLTLHTPGPPWSMPWTSRVSMAFQGTENITSEDGSEDEASADEHTRAHVEGRRLSIFWHHARHSIDETELGWTFMGLGLVSVLALQRGRRLALLVPLVTTLPALVIFSQARHVEVAVPAALAALAAAMSRGWKFAVPLGLIAALPVRYGIPYWEPYLAKEVRNAQDSGGERSLGAALCVSASPVDVVSGELRDFLAYCPLPYHRLDSKRAGADWNTWYVGESAPGPAWEAVGQVDQRTWVFRMLPDLDRGIRPCHEDAPVPGTPYISFPQQPAILEPPCALDRQDTGYGDSELAPGGNPWLFQGPPPPPSQGWSPPGGQR